KKQTAYMAPTEILASQHYMTIRTLLRSNAVALLTSSRSEVNGAPCSRAELQRQIAGNDIDLVIGTHALIQEDVRFLDLAFAIVDEQHRFGVEQRKKLRAMSGNPETLPHLLSMTATPIPRTLALTIFGDLDLSILDEKPQNRTPIQTRRASLTNLESVFSHIQSEVQSGHQAFVVCPLIQESDILPRSSAESVYAEWKQRMPNIRMELLHGKMKTADKESTMQQFYGHNIDVLIATAVIEVGVDVPNATMMVILGAERFGLAQLHQFRGRVGRAEHASYCYVIPDDDNSGRERIDAFVASNDGFQLAEFDLQSRGPGEVYGRRQSGIPNFNVATLQDAHMIQRAQQLTRNILERDSTLTTFPILQQRVHQFLEQLHLE
ncbi:MAG: DEAD/DEAH box helicase, partial [Candidatus Kerfeldbacteria bacterium]|nr:DEAD/DEAH box helicase [Candidatus Kerfeldbacteria bacterium]